MEIEKDLKRIEKLARDREKANWAFRSFLKASDWSTNKVDITVHQFYREVSSQIECTSCANCCRKLQPLLTRADVNRLSKAEGLSINRFRARYLQPTEDREGETFNTLPCPFLRDNQCSVYEYRPADCRSFPHLHKGEFLGWSMQLFLNCKVCPIVSMSSRGSNGNCGTGSEMALNSSGQNYPNK
jgi:uncharacterized protein